MCRRGTPQVRRVPMPALRAPPRAGADGFRGLALREVDHRATIRRSTRLGHRTIVQSPRDGNLAASCIPGLPCATARRNWNRDEGSSQTSAGAAWPFLHAACRGRPGHGPGAGISTAGDSGVVRFHPVRMVSFPPFLQPASGDSRMTFLARHLGLSPGARLPEVPAEIRLGLRSVPELADHGFHDMVVLPGSFFVDLALALDELVSGAAQRRALDSVFHNPVILSGKDDVVIGILVRQHEGSRVSYAFFEKQGEAAVDPARHAAEVRVERLGGSQAGIAPDPAPSLQDLASPTAGAECYDGLRANGNQYGPACQGITALQADRERVLAKIDASPAGATPFHRSRTRLLDVMAQLLAPLLSGPGKTFILKSIDRIEVADAEPPATLWGEATVTGGAGSAARGAVRLFDATGRVHAAMSGVAFALLDSGRTAAKPAAPRLGMPSNFP